MADKKYREFTLNLQKLTINRKVKRNYSENVNRNAQVPIRDSKSDRSVYDNAQCLLVYVRSNAAQSWQPIQSKYVRMFRS